MLKLPRLKLSLGIAILVFLGLLATDAVPPLRGGAGWQWDYASPEDWTPVYLLAGALFIYSGGGVVFRRFEIKPFFRLIWALVGMVSITLLALNIQGDPFFLLFTRTVSPVQSGASTLAVYELAEEDVQPSLNHWTDIMEKSKPDQLNIIHFTTHPPGQPLAHYAVAQPLDRLSFLQATQMDLRAYQCSDLGVMTYTQGEILSAGAWGILMPFWAALAIIPIFLTVRLFTENKILAADTASWWALIPSILLFTPTWNTLYPFLCITAFYALAKGLKSKPLFWVGVAGMLISLTTLLTFSVLPVGLLFALYVLGVWWWLERPLSQNNALSWLMQIGAVFILGFMSLWLIFWLYSNTSPFAIFNTGIENHREIVQRADYLAWVFLHLYDLFLFTGWAVVGLFLLGIYFALKNLRQGHASPSTILGVALGLTMIIGAVSGTAQGETARLLTFYIPFMLIVAALSLQNGKGFHPLWWGVQAVTVLVMATYIPVIPQDLNDPPQAPRQDVPNNVDWPFREVKVDIASMNYEGSFRLAGFRAVGDPGIQSITVQLEWEGISPTERPYQFRIIARAENDIDGEIVSEAYLWYPQSGNYLTSCWQEGDQIRDVFVLTVPPVAKPVQWTLELQAIDYRTDEIIPAEPILLGPIDYGADFSQLEK